MKDLKNITRRKKWAMRIWVIVGALPLIMILWAANSGHKYMAWVGVIYLMAMLFVLVESANLAFSSVYRKYVKENPNWVECLDKLIIAGMHNEAFDAIKSTLIPSVANKLMPDVPDSLKPLIVFLSRKYDVPLDQHQIPKYIIDIIQRTTMYNEKIYKPILMEALNDPGCQCQQLLHDELGIKVEQKKYTREELDSGKFYSLVEETALTSMLMSLRTDLLAFVSLEAEKARTRRHGKVDLRLWLEMEDLVNLVSLEKALVNVLLPLIAENPCYKKEVVQHGYFDYLYKVNNQEKTVRILISETLKSLISNKAI